MLISNTLGTVLSDIHRLLFNIIISGLTVIKIGIEWRLIPPVEQIRRLIILNHIYLFINFLSIDSFIVIKMYFVYLK